MDVGCEKAVFVVRHCPIPFCSTFYVPFGRNSTLVAQLGKGIALAEILAALGGVETHDTRELAVVVVVVSLERNVVGIVKSIKGRKFCMSLIHKRMGAALMDSFREVVDGERVVIFGINVVGHEGEVQTAKTFVHEHGGICVAPTTHHGLSLKVESVVRMVWKGLNFKQIGQ